MKNELLSRDRRVFVSTLLAAAATASPLASVSVAFAAEMPRVDPGDPTASALKYVHDASAVDASTRGGDDRICGNCQLYTGGDAEWGPCSIFPGKSVARAGWCQAWVPKA